MFQVVASSSSASSPGRLERQALGTERVHCQRRQTKAQHGAAVLDDHTLDAGIDALCCFCQKSQVYGLSRRSPRLADVTAGRGTQPDGSRERHRSPKIAAFDQLFQPCGHLVGVADHRAFMLQRDVRHVPTFAAAGKRSGFPGTLTSVKNTSFETRCDPSSSSMGGDRGLGYPSTATGKTNLVFRPVRFGPATARTSCQA